MRRVLFLHAWWLVAVLATGAWAAPPRASKARKKAAANSVLVLMWGGGATPEAAEKARREFAAVIPKSTQPVVVLESKKVTGLKPGFHVAAIGVCPIQRGLQLVQQLRVFSRGVYARLVPPQAALKGLECPTITFPPRSFAPADLGGDEKSAQFEARTAVGPHALIGELTVTAANDGEFASGRFSVLFRLEDVTGSTLSSATVSTREGDVDVFEGQGSRLVLGTTEYPHGRCDRLGWLDYDEVESLISVKNGTVEVTRKVTSTGVLCQPMVEGMSGDGMAREVAIWQQAMNECKGADREACEAALEKARSDYAESSEGESSGD